MRDGILHGSVRALIPEDERIVHVAHMWTRHPLTLVYGAAAFIGFLVLGFVLGIEQWSGRIGLAFAGAAVATMATTEYRILVQTGEGLVLLASSRIRQRATSIIGKLPKSAEVRAVGNNLVITDSNVDGHVYSVMKRHQAAMVAMSER